jgi:long-chain fatty acid transport protein
MNRVYKWLPMMMLTTAVVLPATSHATNGMFLIGQGTKSRGAGGVAIAMPQDAVAGAINPASIGFVGTRLDVGMDVFMPKASAELGGLKVNSSADLYAFPAGAVTYKFNRKLSFGFSAIPAGGGGSRYNTNLYNNLTGANVDETLGINLAILQMAPTVSYAFAKDNTIGFSPVFSIQQFRAFGLDYFSNFTSTGLFTDTLSNNGNDYAYGAGARFGWMGKFFDKKLSLGAVYTSTIHMTKFNQYEDLFANHGELDTPANFGVGIAYKLMPKLTVGLDITRTLYSDVNAIGNKTVNVSGSPFPESQEKNALGQPDGLGFEWRDQTVFKIGALYDYNSQWTFRVGWNYGKSPMREITNGGNPNLAGARGPLLFGVVAPAVVQNLLTLGTTYSPSKQVEWSFSYIHAFQHKEEGPTLIGDTATLKMYQNSYGVSFGYKL